MKNLIKIKFPPLPENGLPTGVGTTLEMPDGTEIKGITSVQLGPINVGDVVTAEFEITGLGAIAAGDAIWAQAIMDEESFLIAAEHHGYDVTKRK